MDTALLHLHLALAIVLFLLLLANRIQRWRWLSAGLAVMLLLTGAHNFVSRMAGAPKFWHPAVGLKVLLALHVIAIVLLMTRGGASPEKIARWRKGALVSATLAMIIGLYFSNFAR
jgi:hypothetical protein